MMDWKKPLVGSAVMGLVLCAVVMLIPESATACCSEPQVETWVETPTALTKTDDGDCNHMPGTRCHEQCVSWDGGPPQPTNYFQCR
ncbi:MAG: hypothetical protein AAF657_14360 [Acidobacteriota bacterium]